MSNINNNLTVFIPSYNEDKNIYKTLSKLKRFKKVVLLDSFSSDKTLEIAKKFKNVKIKSLKFEGYVKKLNSCIKLCNTKWIMIIDADYLISKHLVNEILNFNIKDEYVGANSDIYHYLYNTAIKENLYPSKIILFKKNKAEYYEVGHKEVLKINGKIRKFKNFILHEDKKSSKRWISGQIKIADSELNYIFKNKNKLKFKDKIRLIPILPILLLMIYYLFKINILKYGFVGIIFLYQRIIFESILNFKLIKRYFSF